MRLIEADPEGRTSGRRRRWSIRWKGPGRTSQLP